MTDTSTNYPFRTGWLESFIRTLPSSVYCLLLEKTDLTFAQRSQIEKIMKEHIDNKLKQLDEDESDYL